MQSQRQRVYSYSSNETILETYSSSPPSSTGLVDQSLIPTWQLSARDLIAPLCQDGSSSRTVGPQKQVHDNGRLAVAIEGQQEMPKVVGEHHGDESEESIDWDARSEEAQEQWRHPRVDRRATAIATYPQTVGFWFDWWIGQIGFAAFDVSSSFSLIMAPMLKSDSSTFKLCAPICSGGGIRTISLGCRRI